MGSSIRRNHETLEDIAAVALLFVGIFAFIVTIGLAVLTIYAVAHLIDPCLTRTCVYVVHS